MEAENGRTYHCMTNPLISQSFISIGVKLLCTLDLLAIINHFRHYLPGKYSGCFQKIENSLIFLSQMTITQVGFSLKFCLVVHA